MSILTSREVELANGARSLRLYFMSTPFESSSRDAGKSVKRLTTA